MRAVIDTNVLVSAALKDRDPEAVILWIAAQADWEWVVSPEIMAEYKEVLSRDKFQLLPEVRQKWSDLLDALTAVVEVDIPVQLPRDQKDAMFLACALAAQADYFITGDRDFTEARKLVSTTILSVTLFKKLILST
ncbi:MAG: putative toxin-antitoxin system toxin component, PIN family [Candidatus Handelsmanbacteria bacterium RIFCSPLOWO2_12_FULL_64_10]|uniref:Putative toxin-antitoxin system toxin component, PIN family n=1 Tax=Handelsmanbacteria sp. (strain RIFCSPLOWO2_12_FULL_64_10) TaxID=1817868 RepID=A0A1F6CDF3_HANXR|nr:MAG: putative toxin-antitoxin system toxin component, PIN family [Candidatus Handelsmanbacteria bacterium RIFCSPLOWO2_12_FULL_64_10]